MTATNSQHKLALGTAQLGMKYGIANQSNQPDSTAAHNILHMAADNNVRIIDTARAYGNAEQVIGAANLPDNIIISTKLSPNADDQQSCITSLKESLTNLQRESIDVLMLHRWEQMNIDSVWNELIAAKNEGKIKHIGVSVQNPTEAYAALANETIEWIQLPCNLLDWRLDQQKMAEIKTNHNASCHIQVRSILLQGLLTLTAENWPEWLDSTEAKKYITLMEQSLKQYDRVSIADLAYAYINGLDWVDSIVIGVENIEQLKENLHIASQASLDEEALSTIKNWPHISERVLNPALW